MTSSSLYLPMTGPEENSALSKNGGDKVLKRKEIPHTLYSFIFLYIPVYRVHFASSVGSDVVFQVSFFCNNVNVNVWVIKRSNIWKFISVTGPFLYSGSFTRVPLPLQFQSSQVIAFHSWPRTLLCN